jgi:hypothetical protein
MKKIFWTWNLVHYFVYKWISIAHHLFNYINPIRWIYRNTRIKKFYAKHGVEDMNKYIDDIVFNNPKKGINSIWAGIYMGGITILLEYSIINFFQFLSGKVLIQYLWTSKIGWALFASTLLIPSTVINYTLLFKNNNYLIYFNQFEKMAKHRKTVYGIVCFFFNVIVWLVILSSFYVLLK